MIEINLLPKELRKKKIKLPDISFLPIIIGIVGIIVIVHLTFSLAVNFKARSLKHLEKKWQELSPAKKSADKLMQELNIMRSKIGAIDDLIQGRISWAKKLSDLSDAMIDGVWLNRLWIERKVIQEKREVQEKDKKGRKETKTILEKIEMKTLHLNGSVIVTGGEETAAVGKFMWSLENNAGFFEDFSGVESVYMQHSKLKDLEVMNFELTCYFK